MEINTDQAAVTEVDPALEELKAAAEKAPTNGEEARAQIEAEKAAAEGKTRPEGVPEKFWDAEKGEVRTEELLKSYTELEKSKAPAEEEAGETDEKSTEQEEQAEEKPADEGLKPAKALVEQLTASWEENGEYSEADYAAAAELGFDKDFVDQYTAGQKALAEEATRRITESAGGKENLDRIFAWASTAMTEAEIDKVNASFQGNDINAAVLAMEGLRAKHAKATGTGQTLVTGKATGGAVDTFASQAEVTEAMSDPRYKKDPAYRQSVMEKLGRSNYRR